MQKLPDIRVLYEDNHLIVLNKKPSQIVQGDKTGDVPLDDLVRGYIRTKYNKPGKVYLGVVHRLDRPVSGCILYARTSKALGRMNALFQQGAVRKVYWAVVESAPPQKSGTLRQYLLKNQKQNKSYTVDKTRKGAKLAVLNYTFLAESDHYYLLEVDLQTGRHHQIRAQLASMGCIVKGDLKYGAKRSNPDKSIGLHARTLSFRHPVKKEPLTINAPLPEDPLWQYFSSVVS